ncbi:SMI1/KNR4 family protein [Paenibacillus sp. 102]|uniref:SMI1/KNR4 family protein n=1 Tax=Paenibacillus sp. 102 TaxID=3120823 RepID=UPI0031B9E88D
MGIFEELNAVFRLDVQELPAREEEIRALQNFSSIEVPLEYIEIVRQVTNVEINVCNDMYIRIWGPTDCIEMNEAYHIQKYIPYSLAIGDDEGGKVLTYASGIEGFGVYLVDLGNLDIQDSIKLTASLKLLLKNGIGIEKLLY